ncbi:hypothetical protein A33M_3402 [Rhodovulum sp. PH10]|nr:hypothetical protein A33M_3402 [Rhodovulum sp. PH10]
MIPRRRSQRGEDLHSAAPSHRVGAPAGNWGPVGVGVRPGGTAISGVPCPGRVACSFESVNCTVQVCCSPVSTSKKPVRSYPRARQSSVPRIVNSLSRVHM